MMEARNRGSSHWWWFENNDKSNSNRSPWLQTTLSELDEKTKHMLKLIEEDADSFAARAEWLYKKRPELISLVEDFYRTHRSLAERYDLAKFDIGNNRLLSLTKHRLGKCLTINEKPYDTCSEGEEEFGGSEVDDPEGEEIVENHTESQTREVSSSDSHNNNIDNNNNESCNNNNNDEELMRVREEVERLRMENKLQKEQLMQKDEEKRHVIRQLSLAMDLLREENVKFVKCVAKKLPKKESPLVEFNMLKENFLVRLFNGFIG